MSITFKTSTMSKQTLAEALKFTTEQAVIKQAKHLNTVVKNIHAELVTKMHAAASEGRYSVAHNFDGIVENKKLIVEQVLELLYEDGIVVTTEQNLYIFSWNN